MHPPRILSEPGRECYSLGPSLRPTIIAIRTIARSMAGFTRQGKILLEYNLSTFQVITYTGCACVTYNHRDSCVYYHHVVLWLHVWILPQAIVCV